MEHLIEMILNARKDIAMSKSSNYDDSEIINILQEYVDKYTSLDRALIEAINNNDFDFIDIYIIAKERNLLDSVKSEVKITLLDDYYIHIVDNIFFIKQLVEKKDKVAEKQYFLFELKEAVEYNDIIDMESYKVIRAYKRKKGDFQLVEVEIESDSDYLTLLSSNVYANDIYLYKKIKEKLKECIEFKKKISTKGFAIVKNNFEVIIPERIEKSNIYYSNDYYSFMDMFFSANPSQITSENIAYYIARLTKPHNLLMILSLLSSMLIHIWKPNPLPPVFIWGASGAGKTKTAEVFSFVKLPYTTNTIHQYLGFTSGFRCGLAFFDEKSKFGGEILQDLIKQSSTNLGRVWRRSRDVLYISNMQIMSIANLKPRFLVNSDTEITAILRRGWFLQVEKEDVSKEYASYIDYLELHKFEMLKLLYFGVKKHIFEIFAEDKYVLLENCFNLLNSILKDYDEEIDDEYFKELVIRMKKAENESFRVPDVISLILSVILKYQIDLLPKLRKDDVFDPEVAYHNYIINGMLAYDDKLVINQIGWSKVAKELSFPEFESYNEILEFLFRMGIGGEYAQVRICDYRIRGIVIHHNLQLSEYSELEEKIIQYIETAGRPVMEYELYSIDENEEMIEKILEKLKKEGRISEIRPGEYII